MEPFRLARASVGRYALATILTTAVGCGGSKSKGPAPDTVPPTTLASPDGGTYDSQQTVSLICQDAESGCAGTRYTLDGTTPTVASPLYTSALTIKSNTTLRFYSVDSVGNAEAPVTEDYLVDLLAPVTTASPAAGSFASAQTITLSCDDGDGGSGCAATYYTLDGSEPSTASTRYTAPIALVHNAQLRFFSVDAVGHAESPATAEYVIDLLAPTTAVSPGAGSYGAPQSVTLACDDGADGSGCAATFFTTDGSDPTTSSTIYAAPIPIAANTTLKFFSVDAVGHPEAFQSAAYVIDTTGPSSIASPPGGSFATPQVVQLICDDGAGGSGCAGTWFTTDGSTPTTDSNPYSTQLAIQSNTTLRFFSVDAVGNPGPARTEVYVIDRTPPVTTATPAGGTYQTAQSVALSCGDGVGGSGCSAIHYTTDGTSPTLGSPVYSSRIPIASNTTLRYFAVDAVGNAEVPKTSVYVIDGTAPVTSASPAAGTYTTPQSVTLTCSDGAGSGCATTWYTTDGSTPGTGSPVYASPVALAEGTTNFKFRSKDTAGNVEATQTRVYVVDTVHPTITTTSPADGATNVPTNATVKVTFSEAMDATTITASAFFVDGVTGVVSYDAPTHVATFTPGATLAGSTLYVAHVTTGVRDIAQNAMSAARAFSFTTRPPVRKVSGTGAATLINHGTAWTAGGDGMAAWVADTGASCKLYYAMYSAATSSWAAESLLYGTDSTFGCANGDYSLGVASNGTTFMLAWREGSNLVAQEFSASGTPGTKQTVQTAWSSRYTFNTLHLASNGAGYAITYAHSAGVNAAHASVYSGGAWSTPRDLQTSTSDCQEPAIAGGANGYLVVWKVASGPSFASRYTTAAGWSADVQISSATDGFPEPATSGSTFAVAYARSGIWVRQGFDGTTWGAEVSATGGASSPSSVYGLASNGSGFAVVFTASGGGYANVFAAGSWGTAAVVENQGQLYRASIGSNGSGYSVLAEQIDSANKTRNIWVAGYAARPSCSPSGSSCWANQLAESALPIASDPDVARRGSVTALTWDQESSGKHQIQLRTFDGTTLGAQTALMQGTVSASAKAVQMAVSSSGLVMAVWEQYSGGQSAVFASIWNGTSWGTPSIVASPAWAPGVASNGTGFAVAYEGSSGVSARIWSGGSFGASAQVGFYSGSQYRPIAVASDGAGYAVAYGSYNGIYANVYEAGAWGTLKVLDNGSGSVMQGPFVESNRTTYLVAWAQQLSGGTFVVSAEATRSAGVWTFGPNLFAEGQAASVSSLALASNGSTYRIVFGFGIGMWTNTWNGAWSTESKITAYSGSCQGARLVSNGSDYLAAYKCDVLRTNYYDGTWTEGAQASNQTDPRLASNGSGFAMTWLEGWQLRGSIFTAATKTWSAPQDVSEGNVPNNPASSEVVFDGGYHAAWAQWDAGTSGNTSIWARRDF